MNDTDRPETTDENDEASGHMSFKRTDAETDETDDVAGHVRFWPRDAGLAGDRSAR